MARLAGLREDYQANLGNLQGGAVDIAAGESTILYILPSLVANFRKQYPGIHVHLHNVTGRDGLTQIRQGEVDFAVGSMLDVPPDIRYQPIYVFQPMLIMAPNHPLADKTDVRLEDISKYGLILPPKRLTTWRIVDLTFQKHDLPYQVALEVGGWEVIKRYVAMGMGISIVTSICLTPEDHLVARDMGAYFPQRSYGLVTKRGRFLSPQARRFVDRIRRERSKAAAALV
jgi:DNA-binding transcriptional LysR family regulator